MTNIKASLMSGQPQRSLVVLRDGTGVCAWDAAIAYLAYVFRYTRGWFIESKGASYRRAPLRWQTNVGFPAATYDSPSLVEVYRRTVAAAWTLSQQDVDITIQSVREAFNDRRAAMASYDQATRDELGIEVIPEIAAEVVGFARSTRRREGLYLMVDVGAGTLDACTFRLHGGDVGTDRYSIFTAEVQPLGVEALRRCEDGEGSIEAFENDLERTLRRVIWHTKRCRDRSASEWNTGLPTFLCGGGRGSACHREAVESISPWLRHHTGAKTAPILSLECPEPFEANIDMDGFHRLAVAWGLSYPRVDIGNVDAPSEIDDMESAPIRDTSGRYISKDHV